jgi:hypothetical protein
VQKSLKPTFMSNFGETSGFLFTMQDIVIIDL